MLIRLLIRENGLAIMEIGRSIFVLVILDLVYGSKTSLLRVGFCYFLTFSNNCLLQHLNSGITASTVTTEVFARESNN